MPIKQTVSENDMKANFSIKKSSKFEEALKVS